MIHCYILDYSACQIHHAEIPYIEYTTNDVIESYIQNQLGFNLDEISYMLSDDKLTIHEIP